MASAQAPAPPPSSVARRPRESRPPDLAIGPFKIQTDIGKGSFASVFRAIHMKTQEIVAIKSVDLHKLNKKLKENLYSEIHILKNLHHPHIVALIDCQESSTHIHLVMEFCSLGDLSYFIKKRDRMSTHACTTDMIRKYPSQPGGGLHEVVVRHFLQQLASALEFLRLRNLIHRDIKPQNLLLNPSPLFLSQDPNERLFAVNNGFLEPVAGIRSLPMLKIADFGFARSLPSTSLAETLCGSPLYMAPEILRYEKYDAKADLWSVGTVLYEMVVGRPPFRASNHVELLRRIERGEDRIGFPEGLAVSDEMKKLIRTLLKRNPVERVSFSSLFNSSIIRDEIPGLVEEDRVRALPHPRPVPLSSPRPSADALPPDAKTSNVAVAALDPVRRLEPSAPRAPSPLRSTSQDAHPRPRSTTGTRPGTEPRRITDGTAEDPVGHHGPSAAPRRPGIVSHATAPARPGLLRERGPVAAAVAMADRPASRNSASPASSLLVQRQQLHERGVPLEERLAKDAREKAEQEVAFERDYVLVEKRAVEVNAFADELAASPQIHGAQPIARTSDAVARRTPTHGSAAPPGGVPIPPTRAVQMAVGKPRPDYLHQRKSSYERRYGASPGSATSAISKALNMANFRLFGVGFASPFMGKGGYSPPHAYGAFPAYPTSQGSLIMVGDVPKHGAPLDGDARAVQVIEEAATRSDVVYGFAEVKYKQLIPLAPSTAHGLGLRAAGVSGPGDGLTDDGRTSAPAPAPIADADDGLTADAIVTLSEEALVLFVKALALLAQVMDIAGAWWARKNRGEIVLAGSPSGGGGGRWSDANANAVALIAAGNRINNVVQWVRTRFNEVLEKAEFVTLKLLEAQKQLPADHPSHRGGGSTVIGSSAEPRTRWTSTATPAATRMATSADTVIVSSGVTAEKLMYDRALELSRAAAVNELVGEDLPGCEMAYVTAVRMLEAVLETDADVPIEARSGSELHPTTTGPGGVQADDRQVVEKRAWPVPARYRSNRLTFLVAVVVVGVRVRLGALRKKMAILSKQRQSVAAGPGAALAPTTASAPPLPPHVPATPPPPPLAPAAG
ncbi:MAG: Serine/threonine-protein kinase ulk2 [Phylliscum demangeonii]|nr:MAG: Serine/threonine-protein kinase ulk2 [Phylliscum demangeonii]